MMWRKAMSTPSLPKDLMALPPGVRVCIDANIFIYHFTDTPLTAACTTFLRRVESGEVQGITSVVILAEVAHRLMMLDAIRTLGVPARTAVKQLKEHPDLVRQLSLYKVATERVSAFNITVEPVTAAHLRTAQQLSTDHGLLTNDSLTAALMRSLGVTELASNDPDFFLVPGFSVWQPQPSLDANENGKNKETEEPAKP
jgi:predicted nucleic acid-binding protein